MSHIKMKIFLPPLTPCSDRTRFFVTSSPVSRDTVSIRSDVHRDLPALLLFSHAGCRALSGPPDRTVRRDLLASRQSPGSLICCANSPPFPLNLSLKKIFVSVPICRLFRCAISGFRSSVNDIFALLGCYAAQSDS